MNAIDVNFNTKNTSIASALEFNYTNPYDGILTTSQVSKIIETILIRIPTQTLWVDHFRGEYFAHSYILSAVTEFLKGEIKIKNLSGALEVIKDKTCNELESHLIRRITECEISIQILNCPSESAANEIKKLVLETYASQNYVVQ